MLSHTAHSYHRTVFLQLGKRHMHGENTVNSFPQTSSSSLLRNMYGSVIRQTDLGLDFLYDAITSL